MFISNLIKVCFFTLTPTILLELKIIPSKFRVQVIGGTYIVALVFMYLSKFDLANLYMRFNSLEQTLLQFGGVTIFGIVLLHLLLRQKTIRELAHPKVKFVLSPFEYVFVSVPVQQAIFFGWVYTLLSEGIPSKIVLAITVGTVFSLTHLPWKNNIFTMSTFFVGTVWAILGPNLIGSTLSHMVIGGVFLYFIRP